MDTVGETFVAGVFPSNAKAEAANQGLRQLGLEAQEIDSGMPEPGRYRIDADEATDLGRGAAIGIAVGVMVGGIIGIAAVNVIVPGMLYTGGMSAIVLGFLIGAFWGIFFGGLGGVVPQVLAYEHGPRVYNVTEGAADAVVVAYAGGLAEDARKLMKTCGARAFLAEAPAVRHGAPAGAIQQYA